MKKLIIIACLFASCQKERVTINTVTYIFNPNNNPSNIIVNSDTLFRAANNQIQIVDTVKAGERVTLKMTGFANGGDKNYFIRIIKNGNTISGAVSTGTIEKKKQTLIGKLRFLNIIITRLLTLKNRL